MDIALLMGFIWINKRQKQNVHSKFTGIIWIMNYEFHSSVEKEVRRWKKLNLTGQLVIQLSGSYFIYPIDLCSREKIPCDYRTPSPTLLENEISFLLSIPVSPGWIQPPQRLPYTSLSQYLGADSHLVGNWSNLRAILNFRIP